MMQTAESETADSEKTLVEGQIDSGTSGTKIYPEHGNDSAELPEANKASAITNTKASDKIRIFLSEAKTKIFDKHGRSCTNKIIIIIGVIASLAQIIQTCKIFIPTNTPTLDPVTPVFSVTTQSPSVTTTPSETSTPTIPFTPSATVTLTPYLSPTTTPIPTESFLILPLAGTTPIPTQATPATIYDKGFEMVLIPAGYYTIGSASDVATDNPPDTVYLNAFYIDRYEVTNAQYKACMDAGHCPTLGLAKIVKPAYADYPVVSLPWDTAKTFCNARNAQLPTEAQWEIAARGDTLGPYPWGQAPASCVLANFYNADTMTKCYMSPTIIGSYPEGASPFGVMDLAGNVMEWVNDLYDEDYYTVSPEGNPENQDSGTDRVVRGGSWGFGERYLPVYTRHHLNPNNGYSYVGFRCVVTP